MSYSPRPAGATIAAKGFLPIEGSGGGGGGNPVIVQSAVIPDAASPQSVTLPSNVTAGNTIIVMALCYGGFTVAVSDTQTGAYTGPVAYLSTAAMGATAQYWRRLTASGPLTVTFTAAGANVGGLVYEVSGLAASPVDKSATLDSSTVSAPVQGPNLSGLAGTQDLVVYFTLAGQNTGIATGAPWTDDFRLNTGIAGGSWSAPLAYRVTGPTVTAPVQYPAGAGGGSSIYQTSVVAYV